MSSNPRPCLSVLCVFCLLACGTDARVSNGAESATGGGAVKPVEPRQDPPVMGQGGTPRFPIPGDASGGAGGVGGAGQPGGAGQNEPSAECLIGSDCPSRGPCVVATCDEENRCLYEEATPCAESLLADLNNNGVVQSDDTLIVLANRGNGCL